MAFDVGESSQRLLESFVDRCAVLAFHLILVTRGIDQNKGSNARSLVRVDHQRRREDMHAVSSKESDLAYEFTLMTQALSNFNKVLHQSDLVTSLQNRIAYSIIVCNDVPKAPNTQRDKLSITTLNFA